MSCSNPFCRGGTCYGPHAPAPHPCKACISRVARWLRESERIVEDAESLVLIENGSRGSRAILSLAQILRASAIARSREIPGARAS